MASAVWVKTNKCLVWVRRQFIFKPDNGPVCIIKQSNTRHNVANHLGSLSNRFFFCQTANKETSKLHVTNPWSYSRFPSRWASNPENISISWCLMSVCKIITLSQTLVISPHGNKQMSGYSAYTNEGLFCQAPPQIMMLYTLPLKANITIISQNVPRNSVGCRMKPEPCFNIR